MGATDISKHKSFKIRKILKKFLFPSSFLFYFLSIVPICLTMGLSGVDLLSMESIVAVERPHRANELRSAYHITSALGHES
jgi:hypothetical protein